MDFLYERPPPYIHIERNDFSYRKHTKQTEEDIAICECHYEATDPDSACGERCLNVITNTECTPGYCPCGIYCKNQKFQKCEYSMSKLFKTEGRGWGLLADENIKAGQFIIEYCGEVISWKEARQRSQAYEAEGLKDAFIIALNAYESIDATRKGSLARFINHSCQPNCETRKWTVLGEIRVGIFAKQDILVGTELSYNYNFEWYGGAKVRCLCGATCCSGFLGAKSRGFQEATHLWEENDDRYSVENVPLYDSAEDEPASKNRKLNSSEDAIKTEGVLESFTKHEGFPQSVPLAVEPLNSFRMEDTIMHDVKVEMSKDTDLYSQSIHQNFMQKNAMISRIRSNSACRNYHIEPSRTLPKSSQQFPSGRSKHLKQKQIDANYVSQLLASQVAQEELFTCEEARNMAASELDSVYDEIRPAIEEHEKDSQGSVSTCLAEKWIGARCKKLKAEFDLYSSIVKNLACTPRKTRGQVTPQGDDRKENGVLYLKMSGEGI
ncbi:Histone-lysine N-methyltransferase ASHH1 [Acorus calamus]|uniref:Histone-lysine N-methyltransferase ASHH1 n=1 Tax=Acorus calamus TaxID=4465 RepID=A0AAV9EEG2_ACOCL|nr:Histone-lysine N-methyltransferase ASHH1 [Acorus calamus]